MKVVLGVALALLGFFCPFGALGLNVPRSSVGTAAWRPLAPEASSSSAPMSPGSPPEWRKAVAEFARGGSLGGGVDVALLAYFFFWYLGNYYYNITNKLALKASGGSSGFPMTIASLQLAVGVVYALFAWVAPDMRTPPSITPSDVVSMLPVAFCSMMAHCASVFALSAGAVSFGQIVKAAEPAFAAVLSTFVYGRSISKAKWLCLIPVIGGVVLASVKELDFAVSALVSASAANLFAAFKGNENKKLMDTAGLKDRLGSVGNQFAVTGILSFLMSLPLLIALEGKKWSSFVDTLTSTPAVLNNLLLSGAYFYAYNELATMTIKKTNAITQSVANTAKRAIIIIGVGIVLKEDLPMQKIIGSLICIAGVFLYSTIDTLIK
mmetsp:Transcript_37182/g.119299  ORF Transcript_37182/g.119299 Transcript_37182/m.119299 type:complete len:380 (+) Transcript_37182:86-1225(+)|eukprot:CAMPEP_0118914132 /NCGR_PEP_ID=MMETSP1166-20130328/14611_1 /TAXON_ID=1104430 /ORGANISM="Chrysoreinhardia sp, Strain CCMP3193" /LENGTH=379 /DNA_ID=CAMNT_0006853699 /DNA_START=36 /DNA_END=1175 /DNA_ORIENTATION=+